MDWDELRIAYRDGEIDRRDLPGQESLLETGYFADVMVKCGGREWKLHRCIICIESFYFEKALSDNSKEAETREIGLDEDVVDPHVFDCLIKCIYISANLTPRSDDFSPRMGREVLVLEKHFESFFVSWFKLYEAADYFMVPEVSEFLISQLCDHLDYFRYPLQMEWQEKYTQLKASSCKERAMCEKGEYFGTPVYELLPEAEMKDLLSAIDYVFQGRLQHEEVQSRFLNFVQHTHFWFLHDKSVQARLAAMPNFATAVWQRMMRSKMGQAFFEAPRICACYEEESSPVPWQKLHMDNDQEWVSSTAENSCQCDLGQGLQTMYVPGAWEN